MGNLVVNAMGLQLWKMGNIFKPLLLFRNRECASITTKPDPSSIFSVLQLRNITKKVYSLELESAQTPIFAFKRFSLERLLVPGVLGWVSCPLLNRWLSSHYNSPMGGGILSWTPVIIRIILRHRSQNNNISKHRPCTISGLTTSDDESSSGEIRRSPTDSSSYGKWFLHCVGRLEA